MVVKSGKDLIDRKEDLNEYERCKIKDELYYVKYRSEYEKPTKLFGHLALLKLITDKRLSSDSCKVILYVMSKMSADVSSVQLTAKDLTNVLGISRGHYDKVLKELRDCLILQKKDSKHYWFNPTFFHRGNRLEHYKNQSVKNHLEHSANTISKTYLQNDLVLGERIYQYTQISQEVDVRDKNGSLVNTYMDDIYWEPRAKYDDIDKYLGITANKYSEDNEQIIKMLQESNESIEAQLPYLK